MRTVTLEEAQNCKERMLLWANANKKPINTGKKFKKGSLDEWVYEPIKKWEIFGREPGLEMALTKWCVQYMWRGLSHFPCCPEEMETNPLEAYFQNLKIGAVFACNEFYKNFTILEFARIKNNLSILVMCKRGSPRPWSITEITFKKGFFLHSNLGSYFDLHDAHKEFCIKQGLVS